VDVDFCGMRCTASSVCWDVDAHVHMSAGKELRERDSGVENMCVPVTVALGNGETADGVMITQWPAEVKRRLEGTNKYMKALLECSPYPLCLFTFNGQLITCNPAAVAVFGETIWLQSDIFGMSDRERRGLDPDSVRMDSGSFTIERTERKFLSLKI
jgi:PAS domain-containing protein